MRVLIIIIYVLGLKVNNLVLKRIINVCILKTQLITIISNILFLSVKSAINSKNRSF